MKDIDSLKIPKSKIKDADTIRLRRILCLFYTLDVDQDSMQRIAKELGDEEIMPSLAGKLMSKGEIKGRQELLIKLLR